MKRASVFRAIPGVIAAAVFAAMVIWLVLALGNASRTSDAERLEQVKSSVENGITLCYATEGAYPDSLEHLKQTYGVVYDESRYLVHYECFASNVRPTVTVIQKES